ncbi:MAG: RDD family protein [Chloroflexota bacterium]
MTHGNSDDYRLVLPENVELRFDIAGVGSRTIAAIIDYALLYGGIMAAAIAYSRNRLLLRELMLDVDLPDWVTDLAGPGSLALLVLGVFFAWWGYFFMFEMVWNGQTPGKRLFGLRVVRRGGQSISAIASLVRNVVRAVDMFMFLGLVVMIVDRQSRRLGDFAAATVVVREPRGGGRSLIDGVAMPDNSERARSLAPVAGALTMEHYTLIRDFFARSRRMPAARAQELAAQLAVDIASVLAVKPADIGDPTQFLAAAAQAFEVHHRYYETPT